MTEHRTLQGRDRLGVSPTPSFETRDSTRSEHGATLPQVSRKPAFKPDGQVGRPQSTMAPREKDDRELATLMEAAQTGDVNAYARLLRSITPRLRGYARRRWPSLTREDAEDLVQDVLLAVHVARATYSPSRPFIPWLFAIARSRLVDRARSRERWAPHEIQVEELPDDLFDEAVVFGHESYGDQEALRQAVRRLPRKQRVAIEMVKFREMSLKDSSAASGMSISALKSSIHRALPLLRKALMRPSVRQAA